LIGAIQHNCHCFSFYWQYSFPSGFAFAGFHLILPRLVASGLPVMVAWPSVASVMLFVLVALAVFLLHSDASRLGIALRERACWRTLSLKKWGIYLAIMVVGVLASQMALRLIPSYNPYSLVRLPRPGKWLIEALCSNIPSHRDAV
jgi:hypothetical protein